MTALFESGSSHLHFAWWDGEHISGFTSVPYPVDDIITEDLILCLLGKTVPDLIAACSVTSLWRDKLFTVLNRLFPGKLVIARTAMDISQRIPYKRPETYGIDRALAVMGAFELFQAPCVVADIGTAVTVDAVDSTGAVIGGYIFPGAEMFSAILADRTDLPYLQAEYGIEELGTDTETAMMHGMGRGFVAAVDALLLSACKSAGTTENILVTGGGAETVSKHLTLPTKLMPDLVIRTLGKVSEKLPLYA